jgi:hypothetical protein
MKIEFFSSKRPKSKYIEVPNLILRYFRAGSLCLRISLLHVEARYCPDTKKAQYLVAQYNKLDYKRPMTHLHTQEIPSNHNFNFYAKKHLLIITVKTFTQCNQQKGQM